MKKYTLLFIVFTLLLSVRAGFSQTCDCEALKNEINDLRDKIESIQTLHSTISSIQPTDYHEIVYFNNNDFYVNYREEITPVKISEVSYETTAGGTINFLSFQLTVLLRNFSPFQTKYEDILYIRGFQNSIRLNPDSLNQQNTYKIIQKNSSGIVTVAFLLDNEIDDIKLEICEILPNNQLNHVATWVIPLSDAIRE